MGDLAEGIFGDLGDLAEGIFGDLTDFGDLELEGVEEEVFKRLSLLDEVVLIDLGDFSDATDFGDFTDLGDLTDFGDLTDLGDLGDLTDLGDFEIEGKEEEVFRCLSLLEEVMLLFMLDEVMGLFMLEEVILEEVMLEEVLLLGGRRQGCYQIKQNNRFNRENNGVAQSRCKTFPTRFHFLPDLYHASAPGVARQ